MADPNPGAPITAESLFTVLGYVPISTASPAFTGTPTAPTAAPGTNTTQIATCAFVKAAVDVGRTWGNITGTLSSQTDLQAALDAKVPATRTVNSHALSANVALTLTADFSVSANGNSFVTAADYAAMRSLLDVAPQTRTVTATSTNSLGLVAGNSGTQYRLTRTSGTGAVALLPPSAGCIDGTTVFYLQATGFDYFTATADGTDIILSEEYDPSSIATLTPRAATSCKVAKYSYAELRYTGIVASLGVGSWTLIGCWSQL